MKKDISLTQRPKGAGRISQQQGQPHFWTCYRMFDLGCRRHGEVISVPCGRWRECDGCARRLGWKLYLRFLAGIEKSEAPFGSRFFTLTFPKDNAPTEDEAHAALRSLVRRLRYREVLGPLGWVLQRQRNSTLHFHGIAQMKWLDDGLNEWRRLIVASGFGPQNRLEIAAPQHAKYCARYIARSLADLAPLRRAYSFSPGFPKPDPKVSSGPPEPISREVEGLLRYFGVEIDERFSIEHEWKPVGKFPE